MKNFRSNKTRVKRNKRKNWRYRRKIKATKNQEQKILKQDIVKRRKAWTYRLITRGAILESLIENA